MRKQSRLLVLMAGLIALVTAGRVLGLSADRMFHDEVRAISRTFGSPAMIIAWQPPDWPPLYYLLLAGYRVFTGFHPVVMRYSSVLLFALSIALVYRAGAHLLRSRSAGAYSAVAYVTLGMTLYQSTNVRGYVLALGLFALAFWQTARYFQTNSPRWRRAAWLAVTLAALFYTTYTSFFGYVLLLAYTLLAYAPSRSWRWWRPAAVAVPLALPQIWRLGSYILPILYRREQIRVEAPEQLAPRYNFFEYVWRLARSYVGDAWPVWVALSLVIVIVLVLRWRKTERNVRVITALVVVSPLVAATLARFLGVIGPHYSWWAIFPLVWLAGWALSELPRALGYIAVMPLLVVPFVNLGIEGYGYANQFYAPFEDNFSWLSQRLEQGDVIYIDEGCDPYGRCGTATEWDYYQMVYFPDRRLNIVDTLEETEDARRVWYIHPSGWHNTAAQDALAENRLRGEFVGPWYFLFQLYEAPPDPVGVAYENGLRFHGFEVLDPRLGGGYVKGPVVRRENETLHLRLWWSVDEPLDRNYSLSTLIAPSPDAQPLAQQDGPPQPINLFPQVDDPPSGDTSTWEPGRYYVEDRTIQLPRVINSRLRDRPLGIYLSVYQWWDGQPVDGDGVNEVGRRLLRTMFVLAY